MKLCLIGPMDKAFAYEAKDCGFDPRVGFFLFVCRTVEARTTKEGFNCCCGVCEGGRCKWDKVPEHLQFDCKLSKMVNIEFYRIKTILFSSVRRLAR